jgi:predicted ATPase/class 3 adenylate cyclase
VTDILHPGSGAAGRRPAAALATTAPSSGLPTGTVTLLFTDVQGSTRLWEEHPEAMPAALARHDVLLRQAVTDHGGHVVKTTGDGLHAVFARAADAVAAAIAVQRGLATEAVGAQRLAVRVGLHSGATQERDGDYYGPAVNRAHRVMSAAHGGQVLLSQAAAVLVSGALPDGVALLDLGAHRLQDLSAPERLFQLLVPGLPDRFPPVRAHGVARHNLPAPLSSFVGREAEIADLHRLLGAARLATLTGPGGAGKTRLALEAAGRILDRFPDGVWLVDLGSLADPALVLPAAAAALGLREEAGRALVETLAAHVGPRRLLLLLDNCEHVILACADLAQRLLAAGPEVRMLATSREALGVPGEVVRPVSGLALPDAAQPAFPAELARSEAVGLFVERAAQVRPGFALTRKNGAAVAAICRRLDGLPLAIELAAARVKAFTPEQVADRLDDRFRLLSAGSRTAPTRQQTLRAAVEWSYDLLEPPEQALLARLAVFPGGFALEAAEVVSGGGGQAIDGAEVLDLLFRLVDKSLVVAEEEGGVARYRLFETIRAYALERLDASGEAAAIRRRHAEHYLAMAECADEALSGPEQVAWLWRLEQERANMRAALGWAEEAGDAETSLRLTGALASFWSEHGPFAEGCAWVEGALRRPGVAPAAVRAKAHRAAGFMRDCLGDLAAAATHHEAALALYRQAGDRRGVAWSLRSLGVQAFFGGDPARARERFEESRALHEEIGDSLGVAECARRLGILAHERGDLEAAEALLQESLRLFRRLGHTDGVARASGSLGVLAQLRGEYGRAAAFYQEDLALSRAAGNTLAVALMLHNLGQATLGQGAPVHVAREYFREALELARAVGARPVVALCLVGFAAAAAAEGALRRAARLLGAADALLETLGTPETVDRAVYDRAVSVVGAGLDGAAFAAARAEGRALTLDQAADYALSTHGPEADRPTP